MCRFLLLTTLLALALVGSFSAAGTAEPPLGYYRFPALSGDVLVFTAEGDLWTVPAAGGQARRLTSHLGQETRAAISPDGATLAFSAQYEGATEVYVMPLTGGLPRRLTWDGEKAEVVGWTPEGRVLLATQHHAELPNTELASVDPATLARQRIPLAQAAEGVYEPAGKTLFFARLPFHGSYTKRYRGGTAQQLWRFTAGEPEAVPITADFAGTSKAPMWWQGRLYFASDRDGTMNLWSMLPDGADLRQLTRHRGWDVKSPTLSAGRIAYQLGADLRLLDLATDEDRLISITLPSDFDQRRARWIEKPMDYLTAAHLAPDGARVVLTARGQVFVAPVAAGRLVEASRKSGVRYRNARFLPDANGLAALSDESGEVELWRLDPRGVAAREQLTTGGAVLRMEALPSPDGKHIAYADKDLDLWVLDLGTRKSTKIDHSQYGVLADLAWSPDGQRLAYSIQTANELTQIRLADVVRGTKLNVTSDRFDSFNPAFSRDGKFLYFLSNRDLASVTRSPWGSYAPGPFLDRAGRVYFVALERGGGSPFVASNELMPRDEGYGKDSKDSKDSGNNGTVVDGSGLQERLFVAPLPPGNYSSLVVGEEHLFLLSATTEVRPKLSLLALPITREKAETKTIAHDLTGFELSADGKTLLLATEDALFVRPASGEAIEDLAKHRLDLSGWSFPLDPREEWRQMYTEAWRLFRDYFYDRALHGVDWKAVHAKYLPLVDRVSDRAELSDILGEMSGELSSLHHYVNGGDLRRGPEVPLPASLGAVLEAADGGLRVAKIYAADPDMPEELAPLARPGVGVAEGDLITAVNGIAVRTPAEAAAALRNQAGRQVLLAVAAQGKGAAREVIVEPLPPEGEQELRYDAWELERRRRVEELGKGEIGYVHLRAMNGRNYTEWARHFFPVFNRKGLVIDVRHNRGGNIDSWILGSLLRKAWMWWSPRVGASYSNMQGAFSGHAVVLVDEFTASDGEAFAEGFRRLGLGKVIGRRTWGGEIWLTSSNVLVDEGIATAAEFGVYGPEGEWLIEGHGVEPDLEVDNLPHATFGGRDAQLEAAITYLEERIRQQPPLGVPPPPPRPDKSFGKP